jgi:hypothetical protein
MKNTFYRQITLAEASQAPDTKDRMSGDTDRDITSPVCPVKEVVCCPVSISHKALKWGKKKQKNRRGRKNVYEGFNLVLIKNLLKAGRTKSCRPKR